MYLYLQAAKILNRAHNWLTGKDNRSFPVLSYTWAVWLIIALKYSNVTAAAI